MRKDFTKQYEVVSMSSIERKHFNGTEVHIAMFLHEIVDFK
jgi:hypothetical protein